MSTSKIIGLIGGIGSGKSTVASLFERLGAPVINADTIGHEVLLLPEVKKAARTRWGNAVFSEHGELDRRKLADLVFQPTEQGARELEFLKSLTHEKIGEEIERRVRSCQEAGAPAIILDIPLLLEAQWDQGVDRIIFVDASDQVRLERVLGRGWTEEEFRTRESAQLPIEAKRRAADDVIQNEGNLDDVLDQIKRIWHNSMRMSSDKI